MIEKDETRSMYSLVIPVYRNEESLPQLLGVIETLNKQLGHKLEAIFVVDGSPDASYLVLREGLPRCSFQSTLIALSRNFGSFAAIRSGLTAARGRLFSVMAADLQEPPEVILEFFRTLETRNFDVVVGTRAHRQDPFVARWTSRLFWAVYRRFVQAEMPAGGIDVFGCNERVRDALLRLTENSSTLVGLLLWVGFRRTEIPYRRQARQHGKSGWTFRKKVRYMSDSVYAFSDLPIRLIVTTGVVSITSSIVIAGVVLYFWLTGRIVVEGYTPIMLVLLFSFGVTLFALGIVGSYVARTFENTKERPNYIEASHESFGPR